MNGHWMSNDMDRVQKVRSHQSPPNLLLLGRASEEAGDQVEVDCEE